MPSRKTHRFRRKTAVRRPIRRPVRHGMAAHRRRTGGGQAAKKSRPDIRVKKATYSKSARLAVLASAVARQQLIEMGGENTIDIIREFDRDMSDEELARKTGIKASDVRVVLNRLHNHGLFSYTRVRDKDSGWYSYIWKMSENKLRGFGGFVEQVVGEETPGVVEGEDYVRKNYGLENDQGRVGVETGRVGVGARELGGRKRR